MKTIKEAIDELGDSIEKVAETLRENGIKGRACEGDNCPIYKWIKDKTGYDCEVTRQGLVDNGDLIFKFPPIITCFIILFDSNEYPELIG